MLKIVVAMLIGAGLGAAVTHEILTRRADVPVQAAIATGEAASQSAAMTRNTTPFGAPSVPAPVPAVGANSPSSALGSAGARSIVMNPALSPQIGRIEDTEVAEAASFADAFAIVLARTDPRAVYQGLTALAQHWLTRSPQEAIAALDRLSDPAQRQSYLSGLASAAIAGQPELLVAIVEKMRGVREQGGLMGGIFQGVRMLEDPEPLLAIVDSLPGAVRQIVENAVFNRMAEQDPLKVLTRVESMPASEARQRLLMQSISQLVIQDPNGALAWLGARASSIDAAVYQNIGAILGQQHPDLAAQFTASVPESARAGWIASTAAGMAARDTDAALQWLSAYRTTDFYDNAIAVVARQMAGLDPARAAQLLQDIDMQGDQARATLPLVANVWSQTDPAAALSWARDLPRGESRDIALVALASALGEELLAPATLDLFDASPMQESAVAQVISAVAWSDPQRAQNLIDDYIANPGLARDLTNALENGGLSGGGFSGRIATFAAPVGFAPGVNLTGMGVAPGGNVIYTDVAGGVPQLVNIERRAVVTTESAEQD